MPISLLLVDIVLEGVVRANMQETEIKDTYVKKKKVELSPFAEDRILYAENPTESTKKLSEVISIFGIFQMSKINTQMSPVLL